MASQFSVEQLLDGYRVELIERDEFARTRFPDGYQVELIEEWHAYQPPSQVASQRSLSAKLLIGRRSRSG